MTLLTNFNGLDFKIESDNIGFYLYVYDKKTCIKDYLQDNILSCKEQALEEFGVPFDKWESI